MAVCRKTKKKKRVRQVKLKVSQLEIRTRRTYITRQSPSKKAQAALGKKERKRLRKDKGTLKDQQVQPIVRLRYYAAVKLLLGFWSMFECGPSQDISWDEAATSYIEHLYAEGDPLSLACDTLAGLQFTYVRALGQLRQAWKLTGVWRKVEPPRRVLPLLPLMALGMAGTAARLKMYDVCALILLGFNVFLRTSEMLSLRS